MYNRPVICALIRVPSPPCILECLVIARFSPLHSLNHSPRNPFLSNAEEASSAREQTLTLLFLDALNVLGHFDRVDTVCLEDNIDFFQTKTYSICQYLCH